MDKEIKLCRDCKHLMLDSEWLDFYKRPDMAQKYAKCGRKLNRGSGVSEAYCSVERDTPAWFLIIPTGQCGKKGRFWEPKA